MYGAESDIIQGCRRVRKSLLIGQSNLFEELVVVSGRGWDVLIPALNWCQSLLTCGHSCWMRGKVWMSCAFYKQLMSELSLLKSLSFLNSHTLCYSFFLSNFCFRKTEVSPSHCNTKGQEPLVIYNSCSWLHLFWLYECELQPSHYLQNLL